MSRNPSDTQHIAGFEVSPEVASHTSTATHLVANFIPNPLVGGVLDFAASSIDRETNQRNFIRIWKSAIARKLGVHEVDLEGDNGIALVSAHINELPPALQNEWQKIEDLEGKTTNFLASGFAQIAGTAVAGTLLGGILFFPLGALIGLAGGLAAGYVVQQFMKDATGDYEDLKASEVIPAIHQSAMQLQHQAHTKAVPIDTTLLGAYLIAAHSGKGQVLEGYNNEDLKRMFDAHVAAKAEDPHAHTELDDYIQNLNRSDDNPFVLLLPKDMDPAKIKAGGVLQTIAMNMHSQQDLEDWVFNPEKIRDTLSASQQQHPHVLDQAQLRHAGKCLHRAIDVPMSEQGAPVHKSGREQHL